MYFDKAADLRRLILFYVSLVVSVVVSVMLVVYGVRSYRVGSNAGEVFTSPTFLILAAAIIGLLVVAYMTTAGKSVVRYRVRELIDQLLDAFDDCDIQGTHLVFEDVDHNKVSVSRRASGAYLVIVETPLGIQRKLVVQRYRIDEGEDVGTLLPLSELPYIRTLVSFVYGHLDFADMVRDIEVEKMAATANVTL